MWTNGRLWNCVATLIILAFIVSPPASVNSSTADRKKADIAIVVDNHPIDRGGWDWKPRFKTFRADMIAMLVKGLLLLPLDIRIGIFLHDANGSSTLVSFSENLDAHKIKERILEPLRAPLDGKKRELRDMMHVIDTVRMEAIEVDVGNRQGAPDLIIWAISCFCDALDRGRQLNDIYGSTNSSIEMVLMFNRHGMNNLTDVLSISKAWNNSGVVVRIPRPTVNASEPIELLKDLPEHIQDLLGKCPQPVITDGQCFFTDAMECKQQRTSRLDVEPGYSKYCPQKSDVEHECAQDAPDCKRLCTDANDRGDTLPCNAECGKEGLASYRTSKAIDDPLYKNCPWSHEQCQGPPCSTTTTPFARIEWMPKASQEKPKNPKESLEAWHIAIMTLGLLSLVAFVVVIIVCFLLSGEKGKGKPKLGRHPRKART